MTGTLGVEVIEVTTTGCARKCIVKHRLFQKLFQQKFQESIAEAINLFLKLAEKVKCSKCMRCYCKTINKLLQQLSPDIFIYLKGGYKPPQILKTKEVSVTCELDNLLLHTGQIHPVTGKEIILNINIIESFGAF